MVRGCVVGGCVVGARVGGSEVGKTTACAMAGGSVGSVAGAKKNYKKSKAKKCI